MSGQSKSPDREGLATEPNALAEAARTRQCWLKMLESADAETVAEWIDGAGPERLLFDSRPHDVRPGHLLFCVEPEQRVVVAVTESLADGSTTLHDFEATSNERWLFTLPVRPLAVVGDLALAPPLPHTGGALPFSYRPLTATTARTLASSLLTLP
jgi:hypothetical protein